MRLTKYNTQINNKINIVELVKENAINYTKCQNITTPIQAVNILNDVFNLENLTEEYLYLLTLNTRNKVSGLFEISHGTIDRTLINPAGVFTRTLLIGANKIIIAHNHPTGDLTPSDDDIQSTIQLIEGGKLLGIEILDHIIVGYKQYNSLLDTAKELWQ